jgi:hypothetical protein
VSKTEPAHRHRRRRAVVHRRGSVRDLAWSAASAATREIASASRRSCGVADSDDEEDELDER